MIERAASLLGIVVLLGLAFSFSRDRRRVPWRIVLVGIGIQVLLALLLVRHDWSTAIVAAGAAVATVVLVRDFFRPVAGFWVPAGRGLGLLGGLVTLVFVLPVVWGDWLAVTLLLALPVLFVGVVAAAERGELRQATASSIALGGWYLLVACLVIGVVPGDFTFRALDAVGDGVIWVVGFAKEGADHIFGPLRNLAEWHRDTYGTEPAVRPNAFVFAIDVGSIILLFSALMSVLYYVGFLPWLVGLMARFLHRALGVSGAESLSAAANVFVGQTEAPLVVRPYLARMTESETMALMAGGFATIAGSVLGAYISILGGVGLERGAADLIAASVMSAPAAFVFAKLLIPETGVPETATGARVSREKIGTNLLDALAGGVTAGLRLAVNVMAMLLVFYAVIALLDEAVNWSMTELFGLRGWSFQRVYGYLFAPFAFLMGVPWEDCLPVGELLGTKTIFNEFLAYQDLAGRVEAGRLAFRSQVLATYALCGFANFMSIGIQIGGLAGLAPERRPLFARLALPAMVAGSLACQLTACIVGVIGAFGGGAT